MSEALFGLLGVLTGAVIQFLLSRRTSHELRYLELKSNAYADYVNAVATLAFAPQAERSDVLAKLVAAKARICVFGDRDIISTMAEFEKTSCLLKNLDAQRAFRSLLVLIRERGIASGGIEDMASNILLFGDKRQVGDTSATMRNDI
jgi:hypothetical protein